MSSPDGRGSDRRSHLLLALVLGVVPAAGALALGVAIAANVDETFGDLVRDLNVTTDTPLYVGALSSLTAMVWTAGAVVALATAWPARRTGRPARLLLMLGILTLALALDDQFLVHDGLLPILGMPGELALVAYAIWIAAAVVLFRDLLTRPEMPVLALGALMLAGSLGVDLVVEFELVTAADSPRIFVEDGLKLLGAAVWGVGLGVLARAVQVETLGARTDDPAGAPEVGSGR